MTDKEQKKAAAEFALRWKGRGYEKGESQLYWIDLLEHVLGVNNASMGFIRFEEQVHIDKKNGFIDGYIDDTKVMIEQKSLGKNLNAPIIQSDGTKLTPFDQARKYIVDLPVSKHPRWVVTSNFEEIWVYDMENPRKEPEIIRLEDFQKDYYRLKFLAQDNNIHFKKELEVSFQAGELVGIIYDALIKQYKNPESDHSLKSLNTLCVRIVFCLYAEDAGIFGKKDMFHDYLEQFDTHDMRKALIELFQILDQKEEERDPYLDGLISEFPYVNGGLFSDKDVEIPHFTDEIRDVLLNKASLNFDWSEISPTIFGAVFESTLNPETRRSGGMHYTSLEIIHKVIDPLFLDDLRQELRKIKETKVLKIRNDKLDAFQKKLASLTFFDPACGSGNFLTETYICIRRIENEILNLKYQGQMAFDLGIDFNPIKVSIDQFYGIEINDFAVTVAKTALWIAESQMMKETENIVHMNLQFLPLKTNAYIFEDNSLRMEWENVISKSNVDFIIGNPPFSAGRRMDKRQHEDMKIVAYDFPKNGDLDYVSAWYIKSARFISNTNIHVGFVSTSSITQGEQVVLLWKNLFEKYNINLNYAVRSFNWTSEAKIKAGVHVVIIEFQYGITKNKPKILDGNTLKEVKHINGYLMDAPDIWISGSKKPICDCPTISNGSKPLDNAICAFTHEEKEEFIKKEPLSEPYFYRYMGSKEFIQNIERWFLLINRIPPNLITKMPYVIEKLHQIKEYRLSSKSEPTRKLAETPSKFHFENIPDKEFLVIPQTSSGKRSYIPIGFLNPDVLVNNKLQVMRDGGLYEFGILSSNVHNAWLQTVAGRLRDDYTYSVSVVYNTFPWVDATEEQKREIEKTAQQILNAREKYRGNSLRDMYGEFMYLYPELLAAHQKNDMAVMKLYGFQKIGEDGKKHWLNKNECISGLMNMYENIMKNKTM